jgi:hypothetical protein
MSNPSFNVADVLKSVKVTGSATVLHKPGAARLDRWPLLVHAPSQWGPGIRCECNGATVEDIAVECAANPDLDSVAAKFGVTADHVSQALDYAATVGFVSGGE